VKTTGYFLVSGVIDFIRGDFAPPLDP